MDNEEVVIRQKMEDAKNSLTDKLETLEETVVDTFGKVTEPVAETAEAVKETVEIVKESVEDAAEAVKETVQEGMETVRHWMDFRGHVKRHPWLMMAGSVGAGVCLEMVLMDSGTACATEPARSTPMQSGHGRSHHHNGGTREKRSSESGVMSWLGQFGPEISKLKSLALGAVLGSVRNMILQAVPQQLQNGVRELIDNAAQKLGAEPSSNQPQQEASQQQQGEHNGNAKRKQAEVGRPMGTTRWPS
jgi:ElaB/YqjD/DUF883 family membrane-anchored ribosome-binding protein